MGVGLIVLAVLAGIGAYFLGVFQSHESAARAHLKTALDNWAAQTPKEKFLDAHPEIAFTDTDMLDNRLLKYEIASPVTKEDAFVVFSAKLTVQKDGKELQFPRTYKVAQVKTPQGKEVWAIIGHTK